MRIGRHVAGLIEDGSTMQMGIGAIPDGVLYYLKDKKDLGIHTEMFSDGVIELYEKHEIANVASFEGARNHVLEDFQAEIDNSGRFIMGAR